MVALAAQGEDNFARNDLALFEISAVDHRIEVRGFSGDCEGSDSPGRRTRRGVKMR